jgi:hypothetical protein
LLFAQHYPSAGLGRLGSCGGQAEIVRGPARPGSTWSGLLGGATATAWAPGVEVPLPACQAELLVPAARAADFRRTPEPAPPAPDEAARRRAFPPRVYVDGDGCLTIALSEAGYRPATLGIGHSADFSSWWAEPARGAYPLPRGELPGRLDAFGVLSFDGVPPGGDAPLVERFLADPSHRLLAHGPGWERFSDFPNALVSSGCAAFQPARLREFLDSVSEERR